MNVTPRWFMKLLLLSALLTGCGADPHVLVSYDNTVAAMRVLIDDHASTTSASSSMEEIEATEADYQSGWNTLSDDKADEMAIMEGCTMERGKGNAVDMGMMDDAHTSIEAMNHDMSTHMADHAEHTELAQCQTEESDHQSVMDAMLDDMASYSDDWRGQRMSCPES